MSKGDLFYRTVRKYAELCDASDEIATDPVFALLLAEGSMFFSEGDKLAMLLCVPGTETVLATSMINGELAGIASCDLFEAFEFLRSAFVR